MAKPGLSSPFDDQDSLVVDQGFIAILTEVVILIDRILEHCVANVSRRLPVVFLQNGLKLLAQGSVAAVVHTIGVQDKYVTGAHQSDLSDIGRVKFFLPEGQGVVSLAVRMICGNGIAEGPASGASTTGATGAAAGISSGEWSSSRRRTARIGPEPSARPDCCHSPSGRVSQRFCPRLNGEGDA